MVVSFVNAQVRTVRRGVDDLSATAGRADVAIMVGTVGTVGVVLDWGERVLLQGRSFRIAHACT